jgi:REP element-mobilizing transposase RayT
MKCCFIHLILVRLEEAFMSTGRAYMFRRNLPHWRMDGCLYFVTWRLRSDREELSPCERDIVVATLRHCEGERYDLPSFVVMNDHVHVLTRPWEGQRLEAIVQAWKGVSAKRILRSRADTGRLWQPEYFDRLVRHEQEFLQKAAYIQANPGKRWPDLQDYPWVHPQ